ncbi:hypothetical protein K440DRAFT_57343 [Wilcoxina mikolae CBS 423.85]|nr:hypothetical protein K440DRAFT_57343 [Wilcoxina mikolae CBS 423.85]
MRESLVPLLSFMSNDMESALGHSVPFVTPNPPKQERVIMRAIKLMTIVKNVVNSHHNMMEVPFGRRPVDEYFRCLFLWDGIEIHRPHSKGTRPNIVMVEYICPGSALLTAPVFVVLKKRT